MHFPQCGIKWNEIQRIDPERTKHREKRGGPRIKPGSKTTISFKRIVTIQWPESLKNPNSVLWGVLNHCKAFQTIKSAFKILSWGAHLHQTLKSDENGLTANKMQVQVFTLDFILTKPEKSADCVLPASKTQDQLLKKIPQISSCSQHTICKIWIICACSSFKHFLHRDMLTDKHQLHPYAAGHTGLKHKDFVSFLFLYTEQPTLLFTAHIATYSIALICTPLLFVSGRLLDTHLQFWAFVIHCFSHPLHWTCKAKQQ